MLKAEFISSFDKLKRYDSEVMRAFTYNDYTISPHFHDFYEINIILSGTGTHCIEENEIPVCSGNVFVIAPNVIHFYKNTNKLDVFHIVVHPDFFTLNKSESDTVAGFSLLTEIEPFLRKTTQTPLFLNLSPVTLFEIKSDLDDISDNGIYDTEETRLIKHHTLWKLLYIFAHLLGEQTKTKKREHTEYETQIMYALQYIHNNFDTKITIDTLCTETFMSRSTFLRHFSKACQCTPLEYINRYRTREALSMLNEGKHSKTQIAHACGFYDLSHMERIITKVINHSYKQDV